MSGKVISLCVSDLIGSTWNSRLERLAFYVREILPITKEDTGLLVFGNNQEKQLQALEESPRIKILYKSVKSVNGTPGHGGLPRNTLVIVELA